MSGWFRNWTVAGAFACVLIGAALANQSLMWLPWLSDPSDWVGAILIGISLGYLILLVVVLPAVAQNASLQIGELLLRVVVSSVLTITAYAYVYLLQGVQGPGEDAASALTTLYFSMVTFATLGYGDISPQGPILRLVAAFQAIVGNLHLGLFAAAAFFLLQDGLLRGNPTQDDPGHDPERPPVPAAPADARTKDQGKGTTTPSTGDEASSPSADETDGKNDQDPHR